jgi:type IV pilus assembly protein PilV
MLGLAGLHIRTLAYAQSSLFRSQATALADDVFDRMRADRTNARSNTTKGGASWVTDLTDGSEDVGSGNSDLVDWKQSVESLLPGGQASIAVTAGGLVTVTIAWRDTKDTGGDTPDPAQTFVTVSRL